MARRGAGQRASGMVICAFPGWAEGMPRPAAGHYRGRLRHSTLVSGFLATQCSRYTAMGGSAQFQLLQSTRLSHIASMKGAMML